MAGRDDTDERYAGGTRGPGVVDDVAEVEQALAWVFLHDFEQTLGVGLSEADVFGEHRRIETEAAGRAPKGNIRFGFQAPAKNRQLKPLGERFKDAGSRN